MDLSLLMAWLFMVTWIFIPSKAFKLKASQVSAVQQSRSAG